ncbi:cytochrome c biogenesis protein [Archaeoglobus veneficus]|uniref:Cytochrome c assembly protein n=1 Tax=Archaeoglobus veneficus (strain DSM 11195 / SNP6) TaxID=693661 RepID=F2KNX5_ARCVS|nr:cytochrome c biogenesis protein [Archaeoglobus veneficus]AEA47452.1 cytochrome c assembly protein [Archaeoglobus veneficus SNP6]
MKKAAVLMVLSLLLFTFASYTALVKLPPSPEPLLRNNYRIIFFHLPSAICSFTAFTVTLIASIQYLRTRDYGWDIISASSAKAGFFMITAALISGSIWAKVAWGSYWNWDPRETTVLILWFAYAAYFALRSSVEDIEERAKVSSILAIFCYVTVPLSYLSTRIYFSLHPSTQELSIGLGIGMALGPMIVSFLLLYVAYMIVDVRLSKMEMEVV